ncbi:MAG: hypothetical protein DSM106950_43425 [Stigonema ocellatum SAG 48.90 = DSM 106950]|nr:hypothetical protein [Stigonema ocellatum SAG 48.90 = DSM 106950]
MFITEITNQDLRKSFHGVADGRYEKLALYAQTQRDKEKFIPKFSNAVLIIELGWSTTKVKS